MQKKKYLIGFWICFIVLLISLFMVAHHYVSAEQAEELLAAFSDYEARAIFVDKDENVSVYGDVEFIM